MVTTTCKRLLSIHNYRRHNNYVIEHGCCPLESCLTLHYWVIMDNDQCFGFGIYAPLLGNNGHVSVVLVIQPTIRTSV